jgi:hypothetical protein
MWYLVRPTVRYRKQKKGFPTISIGLNYCSIGSAQSPSCDTVPLKPLLLIFWNIRRPNTVVSTAAAIVLILTRLYFAGNQGCGSRLIQYGFGPSVFAQSRSGSGSSSGSGSGSKLKQNFRRQFCSQIFLKSKFESNSSNFVSKSS